MIRKLQTLINKLWNQFLKASIQIEYQSLPARNSTPPVSKISPRGLCYDPSAPLPLLGEAFLWPLFLTLSINFTASPLICLTMPPSNKLMKWGSLTLARFKIFTLNAQTLITIRRTTIPKPCIVAAGNALVDKLRILKLHSPNMLLVHLSAPTSSSSTVECPTIILWIAPALPLRMPSSIHFTKIITSNSASNPSTGASTMRSTLVVKKHQRSPPSSRLPPLMIKKTPLTNFLTAKTSSRRKWCRRPFWLKTLKMAVINTIFPTISINLLKGAAIKKIRKMAATSFSS